MHVPPVKNTTCAAFKNYLEVPKSIHFDFLEDDVTQVASMLSSVAGTLGAGAVNLRNWLLRFECALDELRSFVARMADWMANYSTPGTRIAH